MPDLRQSLLDQDLGHLHIVAEHWGIELVTKDVHPALDELVKEMLDPELLHEIIDTLPAKVSLCLEAFSEKNGRMLWSEFKRRFGEVREIGPGRRDRERPDLQPLSTAEILWYRALVGRAFFDTGRNVEEFAYIPVDLFELIKCYIGGIDVGESGDSKLLLGRAAKAAECSNPEPANDRIIDHACTLLAGLRTGKNSFDFTPIPEDFIHSILLQAGILDAQGDPDPEDTRAFLESLRAEALNTLAQTWLNSTEHNDLKHVPGFEIEGKWQNEPLETRSFLLERIAAIPIETWWSLSAFVADLHHHTPDFQRPGGDYDSWFIKDSKSGEFLRGFDHWFEVDGALVRYLISGPLHWLGITDIAFSTDTSPATAFKLSQHADQLLQGSPPKGLVEENEPIHLRSDGRVSVPNLSPRAVRYQVARFCAWEEGNIHEYRYRITASSLAEARDTGLLVSHLVTLLRRYAVSIPPNILTALNRWDRSGTQVQMQRGTILRLGSPRILTSLRNSRAARFLGDPLGPTSILVKEGGEEKVFALLVEMGYFGDFKKVLPPSKDVVGKRRN